MVEEFGFDFLQGKSFFSSPNVHISPRTHSVYYTMVSGVLSLGKEVGA
jgi:hypothetical protein